MCGAVIRPSLTCRRDGDCLARRFHRKLAICCGHAVVAGRSGRELVARQCIGHRALARERDVARHRRADFVVADQAHRVVAAVAVGSTVIGKLLALRRYCHCLRVDGQCTGYGRDRVVFRHVFVAVHHLVTLSNRVIARSNICYIGHVAGCCSHQLVASQQFTARHLYRVVGVSGAVVRP